jgi:serine/threonine-protein kinase HipA
MSRAGKVYINYQYAGQLLQDEDGYSYTYDPDYLHSANAAPISLRFPLRKEAYKSNTLFPFFDGLIPEGWYLGTEYDGLKFNSRDRMGLLLTLCNECFGAVSIVPVEEASHE